MIHSRTTTEEKWNSTASQPRGSEVCYSVMLYRITLVGQHLCELLFSRMWQRLCLRRILWLPKPGQARCVPAPVPWKSLANRLAEAAESKDTVGNIIKMHAYICNLIGGMHLHTATKHTFPLLLFDSHTVTCMHSQTIGKEAEKSLNSLALSSWLFELKPPALGIYSLCPPNPYEVLI